MANHGEVPDWIWKLFAGLAIFIGITLWSDGVESDAKGKIAEWKSDPQVVALAEVDPKFHRLLVSRLSAGMSQKRASAEFWKPLSDYIQQRSIHASDEAIFELLSASAAVTNALSIKDCWQWVYATESLADWDKKVGPLLTLRMGEAMAQILYTSTMSREPAPLEDAILGYVAVKEISERQAVFMDELHPSFMIKEKGCLAEKEYNKALLEHSPVDVASFWRFMNTPDSDAD